jgi:hypothetical protein
MIATIDGSPSARHMAYTSAAINTAIRIPITIYSLPFKWPSSSKKRPKALHGSYPGGALFMRS